MRKNILRGCAVAAFLLTTVPCVAAQQPSLAAARELYATAEYQDALTILDALAAGNSSREERRLIELYRTLCLFAVGRRAEADRAIETMVSQDPLYRTPALDDIPPRLRSALSDARKRLLPTFIQAKYGEAKAAFDREDFATAKDGFRQVMEGLADPDVAQAATQPPLSDLRTLAGGFHDLSAKAAEPPPAPVAPAAAVPAAPQQPRMYNAGDPRVVPPVIIVQRVPPFRGKVTSAGMGIIEVVIDETGAVESARMRVPLNGMYDKLVLAAAKGWQYQAATLDGIPVKFRKLVQVSLVPTQQD
jgi:hypothetical protein